MLSYNMKTGEYTRKERQEPDIKPEEGNLVYDMKETKEVEDVEVEVEDSKSKYSGKKVILNKPIKETVLWGSKLWRRYDMNLKNDYAKNGDFVSLNIERVMEGTQSGFEGMYDYIVVMKEGKEIDRFLI